MVLGVSSGEDERNSGSWPREVTKTQIPIYQININAGRREADQDAVQKLADSISKVGQLLSNARAPGKGALWGETSLELAPGGFSPVPPGASGTAGGIVSKAGRSPTSRRRGARRSPG